jgi:hypothetical protein
MATQHIKSGKTLVALRANVRPKIPVRLHVTVEVLLTSKAAAALLALMVVHDGDD